MIYLGGRVYLAQKDRTRALEKFQETVKLMTPVDLLGYIYHPSGHIAWYPLIACVLSGLEAAAENPAAFRVFCQHWRMEHPAVNGSPFAQWYLEPADIGTIGQSPLLYQELRPQIKLAHLK
jgi:hypothetical protein